MVAKATLDRIQLDSSSFQATWYGLYYVVAPGDGEVLRLKAAKEGRHKFEAFSNFLW